MPVMPRENCRTGEIEFIHRTCQNATGLFGATTWRKRVKNARTEDDSAPCFLPLPLFPLRGMTRHSSSIPASEG